MQDTYQQTLNVEQRISLVADSLVSMERGAEKTITIKAIPAAAAQGKTLTVSSRSEGIRNVTDTNKLPTTYYNVAGQRMQSQQTGVNIVQEGDKTARRVLVK